jgi:Ca2+-transporting ATPase
MLTKSYSGLTASQARVRLEKFGPNELPDETPPSKLRLVFAQFKSPLIYILVIAAVITVLLGDFVDAAAIAAAILVNTVLGFVQETKAQDALAALKKVLSPRAAVLRDGQKLTIDAAELVVGDVVIVNRGEKIPADGELLEAVNLLTNEAILTGESEAVAKDQVDRKEVFMGTTVVGGHGKFVVTKTGQATRVGKIASTLEATKEGPTPLQRRLNKLSRVLAAVVAGLSLLIFAIGVFRGHSLLEMFTTSVAIAVAAIPEGLVISLTVILSLGMQRLLQQKALVRKLMVAETLGSTTVICADKTGTLTKGQMEVVHWELTDQEKGLKVAIVCNNLADPTELALWEKARGEDSVDPELVRDQNPRIAELPFNSRRKLMAVLTEKGEVLVKGAPEVILRGSALGIKEKHQWQRLAESWAASGFRLLALGYAPAAGRSLNEELLRSGLEFVGLVAFSDPIRPEVRKSLEQAREAGVQVKVITGDYRKTAEAVLQRLGFSLGPENIIEGRLLGKLSSKELQHRVKKVVLFARSSPEHKLKIVQALQQNGEVVAMMGDGVNDAPALKKAEIGIVVNEAAEVSKETADMVLLDSNFQTIIAAIEEGRVIFENIKKVVLYLLADSFTEVVLIGVTILLGLPLPILPAQILWVNIIEDGLPGVALAFEQGERDLLKRPPRPRAAPIIDKELRTIIFIISSLTNIALLGAFGYLLRNYPDLDFVRTVIFAIHGINSLLYIFSCRSLHRNIWEEPIFANKFLVGSVVVGFGLLLVSIYNPFLQSVLRTKPLSLSFWGLILALGAVDLVAIEVVKRFFRSTTRVAVATETVVFHLNMQHSVLQRRFHP